MGTTCGCKTISEFLHSLKAITDKLAIIGAPLSDDDILIYCLCGLGPQYKGAIAAIWLQGSAPALKIFMTNSGNKKNSLSIQNCLLSWLMPLLKLVLNVPIPNLYLIILKATKSQTTINCNVVFQLSTCYHQIHRMFSNASKAM